MSNGAGGWKERIADLWAVTWPLLLVLVAVVIAWWWLSVLAFGARTTGSPGLEDYDKAIAWAKDLLGLAGTLAGFLGLAAAGASKRFRAQDRVVAAEAGTLGVLGGATLLEVGGVAVPIALAVLVAGVAIERVARAALRPDGGPGPSPPTRRNR
ncbi:MAG: hypothetical protein GWM90_28685 [Gemmatimonadetes bacterium]|nr:hypothetical protein [Gemmatimonadota bacterium]NIQ59015.1 hypothetical protein [Gemmatimonadota bacterium]NIU79222.1 hypothetical protein [Gammaproteobacteria bacterium]NIX47903.1 hypothetical protein [Gemmatimonadota bacterium]NIY12274.1 hypothetical protein [Gemmatimonadota bacterium]